MYSKLVDHALATPNLLPESVGEALLLLSAAPVKAALTFLQGQGKKWTRDIEIRRLYIDLLRSSGRMIELRDFCEDEVEQDVDDWKVVQGWIDGSVNCVRSNESPKYFSSYRSNLSDTILALKTKLEKQYSKRNFALGTIYLSISCYPDIEISGLGSPKDQCVRYFEQYQRKSACFWDIQVYVAGLAKDEQKAFLEEIDKLPEDDKATRF